MMDRLLEKLVEGGPLAIIAGYLLLKMDQTLRDLRDTVRDSVDHFICKGETKVKDKP